jgi:hypothetical protein
MWLMGPAIARGGPDLPAKSADPEPQVVVTPSGQDHWIAEAHAPYLRAEGPEHEVLSALVSQLWEMVAADRALAERRSARLPGLAGRILADLDTLILGRLRRNAIADVRRQPVVTAFVGAATGLPSITRIAARQTGPDVSTRCASTAATWRRPASIAFAVYAAIVSTKAG